MSASDIKEFLDVLEDVTNDLTCPVCSQLCEKPLTFSKCFHTICAVHSDGLTCCPTCDINIENSKTIEDTGFEKSVECAKQLRDIFKNVKTNIENVPPNSDIAPAKKARKVNAKDKKLKADKVNTSNNSTTATHIKSNSTTNSIEQESSIKSHSKATQNMRENSSLLHTSVGGSVKLRRILEKRNVKGETALHVACRVGNMDKLVDLLNQGANPNTKDNAGWTPLHEVVQNGNIDMLKVLLENNALINVPGQGNETALHEAVRYGHVDIVKELVKNDADVTATNSKGETPYQLATEQVKIVLDEAAEDVIHTQGVNINLISEMQEQLDFEDVHVFCMSEFRTVHNKLKTLSKHHTNLHLEQKFSTKVTHVIVNTDEAGICTSSLITLQAIVRSLWILTDQWVIKSNMEKLEPFHKYEVTGVSTSTYKGPKKSRYNKYKQLPGIFNGCHFYLHNFHKKHEVSDAIVLTKAVLTELIVSAGGIVVRRVPNPESIPENEKLIPYHARKDGKLVECSHYIVYKDNYEPMYNMKHLKALPIGWLIECIEQYDLCDPW